jgi:GNAT superfamily N-acetyltransferase
MNTIIICMANKQDVQGMLPLLAQLGYPTNLQELEERFEAFVNLDGYGLAVATLSHKTIGWVAWSKSKSFVSNKIRIHIEGLVVDKDYRGQGIGKKLMIFVEEFAKQFGPVIIDLTSGLRRAKDGSHEFYKVLGYHNEGPMAKLYLRKEL